ncbi:hypothetical protein RJ640_015246 [Escallonia rubra]|uniref:Coiled-coil SMC6 And NSE5 INteracting (CANIN) domain-containing protein n=1 Tax=Escallonia rubra TaxID=112253 RepID=A0AA88QYD1_9ASTE|nr:hypothetical protein RJ640_015246 [Escallonia rubra]
MDEPLDFESEDLFRTSPVPNKKRKKVIGLDDLLTDYYKEQSKIIEKESKQRKGKKMREIKCEDEVSLWGLQIFGNQKTPPRLVFPELGSCVLLEFFKDKKINSLVELDFDKGEVFLESLLVNGWLLKLIHAVGHVEEPLAAWAFNLMLYSSKEVVMASACDFCCAILSSKSEVDSPQIKTDWVPKYSDLKGALETYGFVLGGFSSSTEVVHADSDSGGPPHNIRAWIKYVTVFCQVRNFYSIFSTSEAEDLVVVIILLFLERRLLGLSASLYNCMLSVISFFTENEWHTSSEEVAKSIACRVPCDINCLRAVGTVSGVDPRSKHLRSRVAYQILLTCFGNKVASAEEILRLLIAINVKDKDCDLSKMYMYLVLTENWLLSNPMLEENSVICTMWGVYLRNCSCQISSTDLRSHASKIRSKASYLLQNSSNQFG